MFFVFPLNSETHEKKEYDKYDCYAKCLDDALPRTMNNGLVWECSLKASKELDSLIQKKISSKGDCNNMEKTLTNTSFYKYCETIRILQTLK